MVLLAMSYSVESTAGNFSKDRGDFELFGDYGMIALPLFGAGYSLYNDDDIGFVQNIEGVIATQTVIEVLKSAVDKPRPNGQGHDSFPSGHAGSAMQGAAFLTFRYGWELGLPAYVVAGAVAYSRVDADKHYWEDVTASAIIATAIQYGITKAGYSLTNTTLVPWFEDDMYGIAFSTKF